MLQGNIAFRRLASQCLPTGFDSMLMIAELLVSRGLVSGLSYRLDPDALIEIQSRFVGSLIENGMLTLLSTGPTLREIVTDDDVADERDPFGIFSPRAPTIPGLLSHRVLISIRDIADVTRVRAIQPAIWCYNYDNSRLLSFSQRVDDVVRPFGLAVQIEIG